jgi:hypothetical protein
LILSLCDYTGRWSQPYRDAGYEVVQIDLKHGEDVRLLRRLEKPVHGILAAPPCTAFAGAGARWWKSKAAEGDLQLKEGLSIVDACLRIVMAHRDSVVWWVLENPVGRLKDFIGFHRMTFHPCDFGGYLPESEQEDEAYTKKTCLWGDFEIPEERPIAPIDWSKGGLGNTSKMHALYGGKSERTKEMRSMTPRGFSQAFFEANP